MLGQSVLDKDDILDSLFELGGIGDSVIHAAEPNRVPPAPGSRRFRAK
jgi:hypothetical protein